MHCFHGYTKEMIPLLIKRSDKMKNFYIIILLILSLFIFSMPVAAMNTNFDIENEKSNSDTQVQLLTKEPARELIKCFDVNENGLIAVGMEGADYITIVVLNSDGVFQYGYKIKAPTSYAVEWGNDELNVYFSRGNDIISINKNGIVTGTSFVKYTTENDDYLRNTLKSTVKMVGEKKYQIKSGGYFDNLRDGNYTQLTVTENGNETVIYAVPESVLQGRQIIAWLFVILFPILGTLIIYKTIIKPNKPNKNKETQ